jgi:hypothetical protein
VSKWTELTRAIEKVKALSSGDIGIDVGPNVGVLKIPRDNLVSLLHVERDKVGERLRKLGIFPDPVVAETADA